MCIGILVTCLITKFHVPSFSRFAS